jgi:hypothetical protein
MVSWLLTLPIIGILIRVDRLIGLDFIILNIRRVRLRREASRPGAIPTAKQVIRKT